MLTRLWTSLVRCCLSYFSVTYDRCTGHPFLDVRERALKSLYFKLEHGMVSVEDFVHEEGIRNLLEWFSDSNGGDYCTHSEALLVLTKVAEVRSLTVFFSVDRSVNAFYVTASGRLGLAT